MSPKETVTFRKRNKRPNELYKFLGFGILVTKGVFLEKVYFGAYIDRNKVLFEDLLCFQSYETLQCAANVMPYKRRHNSCKHVL